MWGFSRRSTASRAPSNIPVRTTRNSAVGNADSEPILPPWLLEPIKAITPYGLNYLRTFPQHAFRAQDSGSLSSRHASPSEEAHLCRRYQLLAPTAKYYPTALNLLPWRRSAMVIIVVASLVTATTTSVEASRARRSYLEYQDMSLKGIKGSSFRKCVSTGPGPWDRACDPEIGLSDFLAHVAVRTHAAVILDVQLCVMVFEVIDAVMAWVALGIAVLALRDWDNYLLSRTRLRVGWLCTILMPFLLSFAPLREAVNLEPLTPAVREVAAELTATMAQRVDGATLALALPCTSLNATVPAGNVMSAAAYTGVDFANSAQRLCEAVPLILAALSSVADPSTAGTVAAETQADKHLEIVVSHLRIGVEAVVGLFNGGRTLRTMLPTAVSLAPGMLRGAMRCKMMLPQSTIPGMIIVRLPWLYCPLAWCCYNFVFRAAPPAPRTSALRHFHSTLTHHTLTHSPTLPLPCLWCRARGQLADARRNLPPRLGTARVFLPRDGVQCYTPNVDCSGKEAPPEHEAPHECPSGVRGNHRARLPL